jgi:hypothetical protein
MMATGMTHEPKQFLAGLVEEHVEKEFEMLDKFEAEGGNPNNFDFNSNAAYFVNALFGSMDEMG